MPSRVDKFSIGVSSDSTYEDLVQEELLLKRKQLSLLIRQSTLLGNYYEDILKETLTRFIPKRYSLATGIIVHDGRYSDQLDIIIYDNSLSYPIFSTGNLIVIDPEPIRLVIEVKSVLNNRSIEKAIINLNSAIDVCRQCQPQGIQHKLKTMLVGFSSGRDLDIIGKKCKENGIDSIYVFAKRDGRMIKGQFVKLVKDITQTLQQNADKKYYKQLLGKNGHYKELFTENSIYKLSDKNPTKKVKS